MNKIDKKEPEELQDRLDSMQISLDNCRSALNRLYKIESDWQLLLLGDYDDDCYSGFTSDELSDRISEAESNVSWTLEQIEEIEEALGVF